MKSISTILKKAKKHSALLSSWPASRKTFKRGEMAVDKKAEAILENVARLELAASRGLQLIEEVKPHLMQGHMISVEHCNATIQNCDLFRKWISEFFGA